MSLTAILFSLATFVSTFAGGLISIRFKDRLHYVMAFTAGVLLGVVTFDILPEIFELAKDGGFDPIDAMIALAVSFLVFHLLEKAVLIHHTHEGDYAHHHHPNVGMFSALALIGHSFMDGIGIGLGFQVDMSVGIVVAIAVIAHDFTDGMNTVTLMLTHKNTAKRAKTFLLMDAVAPVLGAASTLFFTLPPYALFVYLGVFAGFLLYIGVSDILPEAHSRESSYRMIALTVFGTAFAFFAIKFAGG
ncbi:MAG: hypothetical protein QG650_681 [Patescibacteria group bacterium]|nr:hypothetical protein [Patescibacteria group bacterium]